VQVLKSHKKHLEKEFSDLFVKALTFKIVELPTRDFSPIKANLSIVATLKKWVDDNNHVVSLGSNDRYKSDGWTPSNQLYMFFSYK